MPPCTTQERVIHRNKHVGMRQLSESKVEAVEFRKAQRDQRRTPDLKSVDIHNIERPEPQPLRNRFAPRPNWVEGILKDMGGRPNKLKLLFRRAEDSDHCLRLEMNDRMGLRVKRPLQAAQIEICLHVGILPDSE